MGKISFHFYAQVFKNILFSDAHVSIHVSLFNCAIHSCDYVALVIDEQVRRIDGMALTGEK
jgi:hypothetical protein